MSESILDLRGLPKPRAYAQARAQLDSILAGVDDAVTVMSTVSTVLHHGFGFLWTGFYRRVAPALLRVGPYQGSLGCLEIPFGKGACGTAAAEGRVVRLDDVRAFAGHIECDARSRSEIVVPVFDRSGALTAVLDIDSAALATFDEVDERELVEIASRIR